MPRQLTLAGPVSSAPCTQDRVLSHPHVTTACDRLCAPTPSCRPEAMVGHPGEYVPEGASSQPDFCFLTGSKREETGGCTRCPGAPEMQVSWTARP